ncbi:MAG TPA: helix-turn-helix transcriptional regulator [Vicinamibacterales bacterium]|nr:helix-turn-helix transcriptional regulator [Vicinamibacterales bacterium]
MPPTSKTRTGELLKQHFAETSISQSTVSKEMGVARPYLNRVIGGSELPSAKWLDTVALGLGLTDAQRIALHRAAARDHGFEIDLN